MWELEARSFSNPNIRVFDIGSTATEMLKKCRELLRSGDYSIADLKIIYYYKRRVTGGIVMDKEKFTIDELITGIKAGAFLKREQEEKEESFGKFLKKEEKTNLAQKYSTAKGALKYIFEL